MSHRGILLIVLAVLVGCGGDERQDADEPEGAYRLEVVSASFPSEQRIAERSTLRVRVRNADERTVPNVALTVKTGARKPGGAMSAFGQALDDTRQADADRPVWIVDQGPAGGDTASTGTWALGALRPAQTRTFEWQLTAVEPGRYTVAYEAAPALGGAARLRAGSRASGRFRVVVDDAPQAARVGPDGEVVRER